MKKGSATRAAILREAFRLSYTQGYQLTSIDDILRELGITKGSFYHHFSNKEEMGTALIDEVIAPQTAAMYASLLAAPGDTLHVLHGMMKRLLFDEPMLLAEYGCPAGNLVQELGNADTHMRESMNRVMQVMEDSLKSALRKGMRSGIVRKGLKPASVAAFLISGYWGVRTLGKAGDATRAYKSYLSELRHYLESLRA